MKVNSVQDTLESAIDMYGLSSVVEMLGEICSLKAEHLDVNWQDRGTAALWEKASKALSEFSAKRVIRNVGE